MKNDSLPSKKKSALPSRDAAEVDNSLGYVSVTEIRNIWTARIRKLDTEVWPHGGRMPQRDEMLDFFVTAGIELMQRAQRNYEQFCKRNLTPGPKPTRQEDPAVKAAAEERIKKLARWHTS